MDRKWRPRFQLARLYIYTALDDREAVRFTLHSSIDIEVSKHHIVSMSNFQCIKVSTGDWMVNCFNVVPGYWGYYVLY